MGVCTSLSLDCGLPGRAELLYTGSSFVSEFVGIQEEGVPGHVGWAVSWREVPLQGLV